MKLHKSIYFKLLILSLLLGSALSAGTYGQPVPGKDENIPFLVTFGKEADKSWGDDHFYQIFFFSIPKDTRKQFYIRVFDPDCGGENDEIKGEFNTKTLFSVYGGKGVDPDKPENAESKGLLRGENYKKGNMLASKIFGSEARYDNKWYSFGPFNATEGDFNQRWNSYIFKFVCEGVSGDDGNLYKYFLSSSPDNNIPVEGANAFTYEYTFRMWNDFKSVSHIYPYIDTGIVYIRQKNFDWDNDGTILVVSRYKQGISVPISDQNNYEESLIPIEPAEENTSLDFQFHKRQDVLVKNNNVVIQLQNQRGDALQFYSSPIGGVPVYNPSIKISKVSPKK
jgi:hypothetical protein